MRSPCNLLFSRLNSPNFPSLNILVVLHIPFSFCLTAWPEKIHPTCSDWAQLVFQKHHRKSLRKNNCSKKCFQRHCSRQTHWQQQLPDPFVSVQAQHFQDLSSLFIYFQQCRMTSSEISTLKRLFPLFTKDVLPCPQGKPHNTAISSTNTAQGTVGRTERNVNWTFITLLRAQLIT